MTTPSRRHALQLFSAAALSACAHRDADTTSAVAAYYYCFPIFEFARASSAAAAVNAQRPQHRYNRVLHRRTLADHTMRAVTTPNCDTVYSSAYLDLTNGPVLTTLPTLHDRYFSIAFMNAYTDNFAYVGTRATGGEGGLTLITGPNWRGSPPRGARLIQSPTNDVWMLARILAGGSSDLAQANAAQDQIEILESAEPSPLTVLPTDASNLANLLDVTNAVLARSPPLDPVARRAVVLAPWGVDAGRRDAWAALSETQKSAWTAAATSTRASMREGFARRGDLVDGWRYPPPGIGNAGMDDELRAAVALSGLAALEISEAAYVRADTDINGEPLLGSQSYELTLPAEVPANGFWSLSMYEFDADGRLFFTENPINRYAIGDRTAALTRNADGTLTIVVQNTSPGDTENWLPCPSGRFSLAFRLYLPKASFLAGDWRVPGIRPANAR